MLEKIFSYKLHFKTNVNKKFQNTYFSENKSCSLRINYLVLPPAKTIKASIAFCSLNCNGGFFYRNHPVGFFLAVAQV